MTRIELAFSAWEADVLPLNYTRRDGAATNSGLATDREILGARRRGRPVAETNHTISTVAEYFIDAVFVLGLALVGMSDKLWKFSQTWIWLAIVLSVIGLRSSCS